MALLTQTTVLEPSAGVSNNVIPMAPTNRPLGDTNGEDATTTFDALPSITNIRKIVITTHLCGINFATSGITGLLTVALPVVATDLALGTELYFWPLSSYVLAIASTILLAGSLADILGHRGMNLIGSFCLAAFMLACGFAQSGGSFITFRAIQGVAMSLHLSSSIGIITGAIPRGRGRNVSFSCLPISMSLGYSSGLVLGGVFVDSIGWRMGLYVFGGLTALLTGVGLWALPKTEVQLTPRQALARLASENDWVGAGIASVVMALLSYLFA